jgi:hypothetical protein
MYASRRGDVRSLRGYIIIEQSRSNGKSSYRRLHPTALTYPDTSEPTYNFHLVVVGASRHDNRVQEARREG